MADPGILKLMTKVVHSCAMQLRFARTVLPLSMALLSRNVNAAQLGAGASQKEVAAPRTQEGSENKPAALGTLIADVLTTGSEVTYQDGISELLGVPTGLKARRRTVPGTETIEGMIRRFDVLVEPSTTSLRAFGLVARSRWEDSASGESRTLYLRLNAKGVLERAFETHGRIDPKGRSIPGSGDGKTVNLDIGSPETKLLQKRELNFWLKGVGRKPPAPAEPAKKP